MVIGLLLTLACFGGVVILLSHSAYREVDVLDAHLRALAVGEAAFSEIVTRLSATSWPERWFRGAPDVQFDVPIAGGTYESLLRDAVAFPASVNPLIQRWGGAPHQVDLFIRATYRGSTVAMLWRLVMVSDSLESFRRVLPVVFTFEPEGARANAGQVDPLVQNLAQLQQQRNQNDPLTGQLMPALLAATTAPEIEAALNFQPPDPVFDGVPSPDGTTVRPNGPYLQHAAPGAWVWGVPPPPSSPPPPTPPPTNTPPPAGNTIATMVCSDPSTWPVPATVGDLKTLESQAKPIFNALKCKAGTGGITSMSVSLALAFPQLLTDVATVASSPESTPLPASMQADVKTVLTAMCNAASSYGVANPAQVTCP